MGGSHGSPGARSGPVRSGQVRLPPHGTRLLGPGSPLSAGLEAAGCADLAQRRKRSGTPDSPLDTIKAAAIDTLTGRTVSQFLGRGGEQSTS